EIAATLIEMHFQQNLQGLVDLKLPTVKVTEHRGDREGRQRRGNGAFGDMVISIGSSNRVSTNHIIGAISERTGLRGKSIGRIEIYPEYTVAGVHSEQLDTVISAMEGVKICGKPVTVTPLADQPRKRNVRPHGDKKFSKPYNKGNKKKYKN
ncbi:MAG: DbpA RNA binding domain-containing protein, partial [Eubacteriales bacterium]